MDREELLLERNCEQEEAAEQFVNGLTCQTSLRSAFKNGARWSDAHPRKGLVDFEKVCEFIRTDASYFVIMNETDTMPIFNAYDFINRLKQEMGQND